MGVRVVTDSACDLTGARAEELGIEIVPLKIRFGGQEFVDREELTNDDFWRKVATADVLPETAAPAPGAFEERFRKLAAGGADGILCLNLSARLSATMQAAELAARAVADEVPVRVIDSLSVSMGLGMQCIRAAQLADSGATLDALADEAVDLARRTRLYATLDTLDHIRKGGRIGAAQALLGGVLSIKPVIEVRDGVVAEAGKVRTRSKSLRFLADKLGEANDPEQVYVFHAQAPDVDELLALLVAHVARDGIEVGMIGPVIGTHAGPGTIGVGWIEPA